MGALTVTAAAPAAAVHPKATIVTDDGLRLVMPFAPNEVTHEGAGDGWNNVSRPGRKPLLVRGADGLLSMSFTLTLAYQDPQRSVEPLMATLRRIAERGSRCTVSLSPMEAGIGWKLTSLSIVTSQRQYGTNQATRATASVTFTETSDAVVNTGPLTGGKAAIGHKVTQTRHYTVKKGDTLAKIALKFYGKPNDWALIARANGITKPRKLKTGKKLLIPPQVFV